MPFCEEHIKLNMGFQQGRSTARKYECKICGEIHIAPMGRTDITICSSCSYGRNICRVCGKKIGGEEDEGDE